MSKRWTKEELIDFEASLAEDFHKGLINCPLHLCGGNEEQLLTIFANIKPQDYVFSTHRSHYHYLLKGGKRELLLDEIYGKKTGCCKGLGRSMHVYDPSINFYTSAIVAGHCAIAVGVALALKKQYKNKKQRPHVWCFCGDGCEDAGRFIEAVRFGASRQLPLTFVIEDNDYSIESTKEDRWHNYYPINGRNILRYTYKRTYPHVGIGEFVTF